MMCRCRCAPHSRDETRARQDWQGVPGIGLWPIFCVGEMIVNDIEIERLNVQLSGDIFSSRARTIGDLIGEALQTTLRHYARDLSAASAGYHVRRSRCRTFGFSRDDGG